MERVKKFTLAGGNTTTSASTRQEQLRSASIPLGSEALDTNYTVKSYQVTLSKNGSHGMIEGDLIRDGGGNDAGATGIKNLGKANVEFPMTIKLLINQAHFLQKEIRDSERRGDGGGEEETHVRHRKARTRPQGAQRRFVARSQGHRPALHALPLHALAMSSVKK